VNTYCEMCSARLCHAPFPVLSPLITSTQSHSGYSFPTIPCSEATLIQLQLHPTRSHRLILSHPKHGHNPVRTYLHNLRDVAPPKVMWPSCDNHATMPHLHPLTAGHLASRPGPEVPTLFLFNLFPTYCMLILLWLLCSGYICTCSHS